MDWQIVLDPFTGRYVDGFDREKEYEFRRGQDGEPSRFRMSDQGDLFNIAGLYWRDVPKRSDTPAKPHSIGVWS